MIRWLTAGFMLGGTALLFALLLLLPPAGMEESLEEASSSATETVGHVRPLIRGDRGMHALPEAGALDFGPDAVPGEAVLFLGGLRDAQSIRELVESHGLELVAVVDELGFARVRGSPESLARFARSGYDLEGNFRVSLPPRVGDEGPDFFGGELVGFESGVLGFLGVPEDNHAWGAGVVVAVLDTGVGDHPALEGARIRSMDLLDPSRGGIDDNGHGTAVVYHLVARDGFDTGMVPQADVLSLRVLENDGTGDSFTLAFGILTAVNEGADVINLSLGTRSDSSILRAAIDYAVSRDVMIIAAAGNDGVEGAAYPAAYPDVFSVAAVDARDRRAPFSNFGKVDAVAPGYGLPSAWLDGEYVSLGGTSAAAPLVTGAVARLLSNDPGMKPPELREVLRRTSNDLGPPGPDPFHGAGRIDVARMERRNEPGIVHLAVTDFFFSGDEGQRGTSVVLSAGFQNRGTEPVSGARARLFLGEILVADERVDLAVGDVHALRTLVNLSQLTHRDGLKMRAEIIPPPGVRDSRPDDNIRVGRAGLADPAH